MRTIKILFGFALIASLFTSCYSEVIVDDFRDDTSISINQLLNSHELWYVDINQTSGYGSIPFMEIAFTLSYRNGTLYANNNLVGIGSQGNGFGIPVGNYDAYDMILDVYHEIDGYQTFDVYQIDGNTIELYSPFEDTSYFLEGSQRSNFDYDYVFYDNIHYFLQEYEAWEKTYTSDFGALNEFDNENYLQFVGGGDDVTFRSSQDENGIEINNIFWDFTGAYAVGDVANDMYIKTLTLDYDYFDNEYFELNVINDAKIELYHEDSGTAYEFEGRGYIEFLRTSNTINKSTSEIQSSVQKKRKQKTPKKENIRENTRN